MWPFDYFKKKKQEKAENDAWEKMMNFFCENLFNGDKRVMIEQIQKLADSINISLAEAFKILNVTWMFSMKSSDNLTKDSLIKFITTRYPSVTEDKAFKISKFLVGQELKSSGKIDKQEYIDQMMNSMGFAENKPKCDVIPEGYGDFGITVTNPVPVDGIPSNEVYLKRLTTPTGKKLRWHRVGSFSSKNIKDLIDCYDITDEDGNKLDSIYICPYYGKMSDKAPKGFCIDGKNLRPKGLKYVEPEGDFWMTKYEHKMPQALQAAGYFIQKYIESKGPKEHEFDWIQSRLINPYFQHLCFAYHSNVYSVLIELVSNDGNYILAKDIRNQIKECENNNLIPCIIPLDYNSLQPIVDGSHLIDTRDRSKLEVTINDEKVEMSKWELNNFGVSTVMNYLEKEGNRVDNYCDILGIEPQIWFEDKNGKRCYVIVNTLNKGDKDYQLNQQMLEKLIKYDGYYAEVSFFSAAPVLYGKDGNIIPLSERFNMDNPNMVFNRRDGFYVNFRGLQDIERYAAKAGTSQKDIFVIKNK